MALSGAPEVVEGHGEGVQKEEDVANHQVVPLRGCVVAPYPTQHLLQADSFVTPS